MSPRHLHALPQGEMPELLFFLSLLPLSLPLWRRPWERFPQSLPAPPPGRGGGRVPAGRSPHDAGSVRGAAGPGRSRRAGEPAVPAARKHDHFQAGSSNQQEALKIEQPGLGGGD